MEDKDIKRKAKRKDFSCEIKARFGGHGDYALFAVKDISATGIRVIITRVVKPGDELEIEMFNNGRSICCKGKIAWALLLRPGFGGINSFDVGVEFLGMEAQDKEFLEKLTQQQ
jgi:hypothetical protein